ncbi:MAG TPA: hypothetical protein VFR78_16835 [Pyrinomonadaceae bacterium]|nr:hypothetical protein [Pyrinomonadaceae bacterium]
MNTRLCLSMLLLSLIGATITYAQGEKKPRTVADYKPRTLRELTGAMPEPHGELFPSRVKVVYGGKQRPLIDDKRNVIVSWANQFAGMPEFYTAPYQTELLFTEGTENYWLAVRKELLEREWKDGEAVELCIIKMGNVKIGDALEPVLLVEKLIAE